MSYARLGEQLVRRVAASAGGGLANASNSTMPDLPLSLLDAVIPGFSAISQVFYTLLGIDITAVVSFCAIGFGLFKGGSWLWKHLQTTFEDYCMCWIQIDERDDLYHTVVRWLATQKAIKSSASVKACTQVGSAGDEESEETKVADAAVDETGQFNYGRWQARVPPRYEPGFGRHYFWHKGRYFRFSRKLKTQQSPWSDGNDEEMELGCVGLSTQAVKELLLEVKLWAVRAQMSKTSIRHATSKSFRGGVRWGISNSRPSRPMSTVILDEDQKEVIIRDMNEFLHPSSPRWYATRGIPYRRGYLFHGPPGTGKTSLSFALAGIFGLDLFCFSLNDPDLTEGDLRDLFSNLPRRCIVLLEDIDEAGIKRPDHKRIDKAGEGSPKAGADTATGSRRDSAVEGDTKKEGEDTKKTETNSGDKKETEAKPTAETQWTLQDLAKAIMSVSKSHERDEEEDTSTSGGSSSRGGRGRGRGRNPMDNKDKKDAGISLSGLLNAIDGVATHEGRVLIMTTNHPDALDEALVRSGRVDLRIKFDYASTVQVRELFLRMYAVDVGALGRIEDLDLFSPRNEKTLESIEVGPNAMTTLERTAEKFASLVPDREFSPADVQGYLLLHKKTPLAALNGVEGWIAEERKRKAEKLAASKSKGADADSSKTK